MLTVLYIVLGLVTAALCFGGGIVAAERSGVNYYDLRYPAIVISVTAIFTGLAVMSVHAIRILLGMA